MNYVHFLSRVHRAGITLPTNGGRGYIKMDFGSRNEGCDLPDGVAGAQTDPLGDGAVLTLSFGKLLLGAEGLVALCGK